MSRIFVTGIGTGVGKTIASAIITEALHADYWKPVQTGQADGTDADTIRRLVSNGKTKIHPEVFKLQLPASPHAAAEAENVQIQLKDIVVPETKNSLVIEGAGGLLVPLNEKEMMIDLIKKTEAAVVLVVRHYLGSINHTLLSAEVLRSRGMKVAGILYSGGVNQSSERAIEAFCNFKILGRIAEEPVLNTSVISGNAEKLRPVLMQIK